MATWTNAELTTEVIRLRTLYSLVDTRADVTALAELNNTRHQTVLVEIASIQERLVDLENAVIALEDLYEDLNTRLIVLESA